MNPFETLFCRAYQLVFRAALPLLPYREPVELTSLSAIPPLLAEKGVGSVLLVTDRGVRSLGLTAPLETALAAQGIAATTAFFRRLGLPVTMGELGITPTEAELDLLAEGCSRGRSRTIGTLEVLHHDDIRAIYAAAR